MAVKGQQQGSDRAYRGGLDEEFVATLAVINSSNAVSSNTLLMQPPTDVPVAMNAAPCHISSEVSAAGAAVLEHCKVKIASVVREISLSDRNSVSRSDSYQGRT